MKDCPYELGLFAVRTATIPSTNGHYDCNSRDFLDRFNNLPVMDHKTQSTDFADYTDYNECAVEIARSAGFNSLQLAGGKIIRYSIFSPYPDYTESIADEGHIVNAKNRIEVCNNLKIL